MTMQETYRAYADAVRETVHEYEGLNLVTRALVRRMFKQAVGVETSALVARVDATDAALARGATPLTVAEDARLAERFDAFLGKQAEGAHTYFRKPDELAKALEVLAQRRAATRAFIETATRPLAA